jgi:predicted nucleic acid-binding protein
MVLIDTSVWIRAFMGKAPFQAGVARLIEDEQIVSHDMVYGELLIGDRGGGRQRFLFDYGRKPRAPLVPHREAVAFVQARKLHGRGLGWIDAHLVASALVQGCKFWTADLTLAAVADELGIAYKP